LIILVSDTSVLIDLERAGLLDAAFSCGMTMVVPDLLYQRELETHNGPYLRSLGLGVVALTAQELSEAQDIKSQRSALSLPDCFALVCSKRPDHCLVSGDKALRGEAAARTVTVLGLLWLLDRMEERGVPVQSLNAGLTSLLSHPRFRLPRDEVEARLARWRAT
jgi:predicted nucleic acid-binding protein